MIMKRDYTDRFGYEQQVMNTWGIVDDIRVFAEMLENDELTPEALIGCADLYEHRFNELWQYFEGTFNNSTRGVNTDWTAAGGNWVFRTTSGKVEDDESGWHDFWRG